MELLQIAKTDLLALVNTMMGGKRQVIGVVGKGDRFAYETLSDASDLILDYDETLLPPKSFLLPPKETLLTFTTKDPGSYKELRDERERIIIGIHPGDLAAIALLDRAFSEGKTDGHYLTRRAATILIGIYPTRPFKYRFTSSMITDEAYKAADCILIDCGDGVYGVETISPKGKQLFKKSAAKVAAASTVQKAERLKNAVGDGAALPMERNRVPGFLEGKERHAVWEKLAAKCFSCGSCVLVCPTCYCFDVQDEVDLTLKEGRRVRSWDGCTLKDFALAAGGHNFRKTAADRIRHRLYRKQKFLLERFGLPGCVGCGRCKRACVPDIAFPVDILSALSEKEN